ncbi:MAG: hypothetical protein JWM53_487 [bacterium]|nr:hypothetical protein [bacterium]
MRLLAPLLLIPFTACLAGMGYSTMDQVTQAAREYNEDVRWGRFDKAAKHVPNDTRQRFIDKHANLEEDLEIADFELTNIEVDKKKQTATARIDYTWSLKTRGIVEKTTTKQKWERRDSEWVVAAEERIKGAPLVFFDEPARAAAKDDK